MNEFYGIKELYSVNLRSAATIEIDGVTYEKDEPILTFDKVQLASLVEDKNRRSARGGKGNEELVYWENTDEVTFSLSEGVISKNGLAILSNSKIIHQDESDYPCPFSEELESDEFGNITTKYNIFLDKPCFIYNSLGQKIKEYTIENNIIAIGKPYEKVIVKYYFVYSNNRSHFVVGQRLIQNYLSLDGFIKLKDDKDGYIKTGIIEMPKIRIVSDLSMRLGKDSNLYAYNFQIRGLPLGVKGNKYVCKITILNEEIDSDF